MGGKREAPTVWGTWEFGGPAVTPNPEQLKKDVSRMESGLRYTADSVESDVTYAAQKIRDRIRKMSVKLYEMGAFQPHEAIVDGEISQVHIITSEMIGTYISTDGVLRTYTHSAGENAGVPILSDNEPEDSEVINTRRIWIKALRNTLNDFKEKHLPETIPSDSDSLVSNNSKV